MNENLTAHHGRTRLSLKVGDQYAVEDKGWINPAWVGDRVATQVSRERWHRVARIEKKRGVMSGDLFYRIYCETCGSSNDLYREAKVTVIRGGTA